jgi:hypothetical protein
MAEQPGTGRFPAAPKGDAWATAPGKEEFSVGPGDNERISTTGEFGTRFTGDDGGDPDKGVIGGKGKGGPENSTFTSGKTEWEEAPGKESYVDRAKGFGEGA